MDQHIQNLRNAYSEKPTDPAITRKYVRSLEQSLGMPVSQERQSESPTVDGPHHYFTIANVPGEGVLRVSYAKKYRTPYLAMQAAIAERATLQSFAHAVIARAAFSSRYDKDKSDQVQLTSTVSLYFARNDKTYVAFAEIPPTAESLDFLKDAIPLSRARNSILLRQDHEIVRSLLEQAHDTHRVIATPDTFPTGNAQQPFLEAMVGHPDTARLAFAALNTDDRMFGVRLAHHLWSHIGISHALVGLVTPNPSGVITLDRGFNKDGYARFVYF